MTENTFGIILSLRENDGCYFLENNYHGFTNKHSTMNTILTRPRFHHRLHLLILRRLVILANILALSTYAFLRIIFYDLPFVLQEELLVVLNVLAWATGTAVVIGFVLFAVDLLAYLIRNKKQLRIPTIVHVPELDQQK